MCSAFVIHIRNQARTGISILPEKPGSLHNPLFLLILLKFQIKEHFAGSQAQHDYAEVVQKASTELPTGGCGRSTVLRQQQKIARCQAVLTEAAETYPVTLLLQVQGAIM